MSAKTLKPAAIDLSAPPGWFGKLPAAGDFVSRRLPDDFLHAWDDWLQHGLVAARERYGDGWLDAHGGHAEDGVRRFWLGPDVLGDVCWTGLLTPSVDRVGRRFPLTIAAPLAWHSSSLAIALAARGWFRRLEALLSRVDADMSVDAFDKELVRSGPPDSMTVDFATDRLAETLQGGGAGKATERSIWWRADALEPGQFACFGGLPPASAFASLLVGRG
ncbi:MAG TPA: type VI secretion system-associated protein TagF [Burkholderiaceae bacterium]|nr:type VI secretion system-associated protein TagF [Burkholderiaceae bacterium]